MKPHVPEHGQCCRQPRPLTLRGRPSRYPGRVLSHQSLRPGQGSLGREKAAGGSEAALALETNYLLLHIPDRQVQGICSLVARSEREGKHVLSHYHIKKKKKQASMSNLFSPARAAALQSSPKTSASLISPALISD